ncbi:MAG: 4Fe-4S binding protein, partial [Gammaproteobacteria bacterium]|nr:4Fe-4S binding protein [Gammaproteobacteria bacterium]
DESRFYRGELDGVTGHLGRYEVTVRAGEVAGNPRSIDRQRFFDVVFDLTARPALAAERRPPGYFAPADANELADAIDEARGLVGEFEKPVYIRYAPDLCARGASGLTGCTRCAQVCPAWAITPGAEDVAIDTHLCQGLGPCATVCPSGAIGYAYPERAELLDGLRRALADCREAGMPAPSVLFHSQAWAQGRDAGWREGLPDRVLPVEVEEIGAVGPETWFALLAFGAGEVLLLDDPSLSPSVRPVLDRELEWASALLEGLGASGPRVARITGVPEGEVAPDGVPPAAFATDQDKRTTLGMALDHLWERLGRPEAPVPLPKGAPLGSLAFDAQACTLCMSCVSICPLKALHDGGDTPKLAFVEQNCVQCGLCVEACPEDALALEARYLPDPEPRRAQRVLKAEEPLRCTVCGKPFATPSVIEMMTEKLRDHPMFQGEALAMLRMCETCRVRAMFNDGNPPPGPGMRVN